MILRLLTPGNPISRARLFGLPLILSGMMLLPSSQCSSLDLNPSTSTGLATTDISSSLIQMNENYQIELEKEQAWLYNFERRDVTFDYENNHDDYHRFLSVKIPF